MALAVMVCGCVSHEPVASPREPGTVTARSPVGPFNQSDARNFPQADLPQQDRFLRTEFGVHAGPVRRLTVDPARNLVVTCSDDKTARIWSYSDQSLQHILRPRVAAGGVGRVYGVSLHPTKPLVAIGGSLIDAAGKNRIHIFDVRTGRLQASIDAIGSGVKNLRWSPDGQVLLATYGDDHGFRAFDEQGALLFEDRFAAPSYGLSVSTSNLVAVASLDDSVHLYRIDPRPGGTLTAVPGQSTNDTGVNAATAPARLVTAGVYRTAGKGPASVAFKPGTEIFAIGFIGIESAFSPPEVVDSRFLQRLYSIRMSASMTGNLMTVGWSGDGKSLVAGGTAQTGAAAYVVYLFDETGRNTGQRQVARDSVLDIQSLADSAIAYGSFDGSWGRLELASHAPESRGSRPGGGARMKVLVDTTAQRIALENVETRQVLEFDVTSRVLAHSTPSQDLHPPRLSPGFFARRDLVENTMTPSVGGVSIKLAPDEISRTLAYMPNGSDSLLGTSKSLFRIGDSGKPLWQISTEAEVLALNWSGDGQVAVAVLSDGTVQWRSAADGSLRLSALVLDDLRWIVWTPDGRFDASAGADRLVGWAVNAADGQTSEFFSLNRFQKSGDFRLTQATQAAPAHDALAKDLPAVLTMTEPAIVSTERREVVLPVAVRSNNPAKIEVRVNGRPEPNAKIAPNASGQTTSYETAIVVPVPESSIVVQIIADNGKYVSEPLTYRIEQSALGANAVPVASVDLPDRSSQPAKSGGSPPSSARQNPLLSKDDPADSSRLPSDKPKLYALAIGVSEYASPEYRLGFAAKDAKDFADRISAQQGRQYSTVTIKVLTDVGATRSAIMAGLDWLRQQVGPDDTGMLFLAGHGINADDGNYYFLPVSGRLEQITVDGVPESAIRDALAAVRGRAVAFIDTCFAGNALGDLRFGSRDLSALANLLASVENGVVVFASSSGRQLSEERDDWMNGAFTRALLDGLSGKADFSDAGRVTFKALDFFVSDEVARLTDGRQTPVTISPVGVPDFVIARVGPSNRPVAMSSAR